MGVGLDQRWGYVGYDFVNDVVVPGCSRRSRPRGPPLLRAVALGPFYRRGHRGLGGWGCLPWGLALKPIEAGQQMKTFFCHSVCLGFYIFGFSQGTGFGFAAGIGLGTGGTLPL